jgi:hypothetical protein
VNVLLQCDLSGLSKTRGLLILVSAVVFASRAAAQTTPESSRIDFVRDVRPLLAEHCFACHGPDEKHRQADVRLDRRDDALKTVVAGDPQQSLLLQRITSADPMLVMPPPEVKRPLNPKQIQVLQEWIRQGADWGEHWAFEPLREPAIPEATFPDSPVLNVIDLYVQQKLKEHGLRPSREADRRTLIRRASLDLTGLPPSPEEVSAFLQDESPQAWSSLIHRLQDSDACGERMAWDWLDAARYADSNGYQGDNDRTMWPWRDWVVQAFRRNMPFDEFTVMQLAGDLLPHASAEQQLATAFCRNHMINGEGGRIPEENRVDYVMDMTETAGTVWLGLTFNCCRCHDHKFDPLTQQNYYQLFAFFDQTPVDGSGGNPQTPPVLPFPSAVQTDQLMQITEQLAAAEKRLSESPSQQGAEFDAVKAVRDRLQADEKSLRTAIPQVMVMAELPQPRETFILTRGLYNEPTSHVVLPQFPEAIPQAQSQPTVTRRLNRLDLARWLMSNENPLTARVTVNRVWQQLFGAGLVRTPEDFGTQGEVPEYRDLLNCLAYRFREHRWDINWLVAEIMSSHCYRQSSQNSLTERMDESGTRMTLAEIDPENRLLARGARFRMPSWMLRDQTLAAAGLLNRTVGGAPVNPYQPAGVWEEATFGKKTYVPDSGDSAYRRSLYVFWRRIIAPTMFFDNASRQTCTVKTLRTNTPMHALLTLNDPTWTEAARVLAQNILLTHPGASDVEHLNHVFERVLCRPATADESAILLAALERSRKQFSLDIESANSLLSVGQFLRDETLSAPEHAAWTALCLAVLNLDEALTRE